ncbi:MAG TPA: hypothetical protein VF397_14705 [Pyrinomonadaceae bacterium]
MTNQARKPGFRKALNRSHAACLLCQVLRPIIVRHRHLIFDDPFESKTLYITSPVR